MSELHKQILEILPKHKCGLSIGHNGHKDSYMAIDDFIDFNECFYWPCEDEKKKCIENDEIWTIHWYPDTPVGFHVLAFSSLKSMINFLKNDEY